MRKGHSSEEADRICGALEQEMAASTSITSLDNGNQTKDIMSFPAQEEQNGNDEKVELSTTEAQTVAQFVVDAAADVLADPEAPAELKQEAAEAVKVIDEEFEKEEVA